jgi:hypothetical protein
MNPIPWRRLALLLSSLVLLALAALPALASAQLQTVDFESGMPLGSPLDSAGEISFIKGPGFRPYRVDVGARAHSGTAVGDLGRCLEESENAPSCEFFHAQAIGQLARTADGVTLFAGMFNGQNPAAVATLTAFRADGSIAASSGLVAIDAGGFDQELSVSSAAGDIASFKIEASKPSGDPAGDLGIDDLQVSFADGAKPDFSVAGNGEVVALVQGQQVDVPLSLARVNGSNGPIQVSVTGLPKGVSATVSPNPVPGTQTNATATLKAAPDAPDTDFVPTDATITADPQGAAEVGPGPRTTTQSVRVAANFGLAIGDQSDANLPPKGRVVVEVPDCAPIEVPVKVSRDIAADQDIALSVRADLDGSIQLLDGMTGSFLPDAVVRPGGGLIADRTLRLAATSSAFIPELGSPAAIEGKIGSGPDAPRHVLPLKVVRTPAVATIGDGSPSSVLAATPHYGREGSRVRIHGTGFCPGTSVQVGNEDAIAQGTVVNDHTLEFNTPRYATTGPVTIVPPGGLRSYRATNLLTVDSFRNTDAFQFGNFDAGRLSLEEFTEAFGNDIFIRVNPCWPFGECSVPTAILHPVAAIEWGIFSRTSGRNGTCFGMALASADLRSGKVPFRRLVSKPGFGNPQVFDIPGHDHPSGAAGSFIEIEHVKQKSDEYIRAVENRDPDLLDQLSTLEAEFRHNRGALVSMKKSGEGGHVVYAYDMTQNATSADIYVWDPNRPFSPFEDGRGSFHKGEIDEAVIHVDKARLSWRFQMAHALFAAPRIWSGRDDGTLWVEPAGTVPDHSTLPGLATLGAYLENLSFGSDGDSVRTAAGSQGAEYLPESDGPAGAGATSGTWINDDPTHPLDVHFIGTEDGTYSQAYTSPGFVVAALDVQTEKGVRDAVQGNGDSLTLASGTNRPLRLEVAKESTSGSEAATLTTSASAGGTDSAGLADGALTYAHDGAPTTLRFSLTRIHRAGGPATFVSGPLRVRDGEHLSVEPAGRGMARMRLTIRDERGGKRTRLLRNRGSAHRRLRLSRPELAGRRLSLRFKLAGVRGRAIAGATLRLLRGGRVVAQHSLSTHARHGAGRVAWRLPRKLGRGRYRLVADVRAITVGGRGLTAAANLSGHRGGVVRLGG